MTRPAPDWTVPQNCCRSDAQACMILWPGFSAPGNADLGDVPAIAGPGE